MVFEFEISNWGKSKVWNRSIRVPTGVHFFLCAEMQPKAGSRVIRGPPSPRLPEGAALIQRLLLHCCKNELICDQQSDLICPWAFLRYHLSQSSWPYICMTFVGIWKWRRLWNELTRQGISQRRAISVNCRCLYLLNNFSTSKILKLESLFERASTRFLFGV